MDFEQLVTEITDIVKCLKGEISDKAQANVLELVDNNELVLSVEFLCDYIADDEAFVERSLCERIKRIGKELGVREIYWGDIEEFSRKRFSQN